MKRGLWRCPDCELSGEAVVANELCLFLQQEQPILKGSGLIVPRAHRPTLFDLTAPEWAATQVLLQEVRAHLDATHRPDGYNVGWNAGKVAGQEILHAHMHVIPRFFDEPLAGKGIRHWLKQPENARPE
jgi:histidine triad (HIT) family protein